MRFFNGILKKRSKCSVTYKIYRQMKRKQSIQIENIDKFL